MARGGRKPRVTDEDILTLFRETDDPVLSTAEIADALPIGRRGALDRLHKLADSGELDHKNIGGRNMVWWLAEYNALFSLSDPPERTPKPEAEPRDERPETDVSSDEMQIPTLDLPGHGDKLRRRQEAVKEAFSYVKEHGEAKPSDLEAEVYPEHDGDYASERSWWKNLVYPAFTQLADEYGLLEKADTTGVWTYTG